MEPLNRGLRGLRAEGSVRGGGGGGKGEGGLPEMKSFADLQVVIAYTYTPNP